MNGWAVAMNVAQKRAAKYRRRYRVYGFRYLNTGAWLYTCEMTEKEPKGQS